MGNVLKEEKKQQVIALGRLGWSTRKIEKATGVRRETAADYLRAAAAGNSRSTGAIRATRIAAGRLGATQKQLYSCGEME